MYVFKFMYIIFFIHKTWKYLLQFSFLYARFIKWNSFVANSSCVFFHLLMFSTFVCQEIEAVWKYSTVMQPEKFPRLGCFANCVSLECAVVCFRTLSHRLYRFLAFTVFYFGEQQHLVCLSANFIGIRLRFSREIHFRSFNFVKYSFWHFTTETYDWSTYTLLFIKKLRIKGHKLLMHFLYLSLGIKDVIKQLEQVRVHVFV